MLQLLVGFFILSNDEFCIISCLLRCSIQVDSVRFGYREADARNGFNALPPPHRLANYDDPQENSEAASLDRTYNKGEEKAWDQNSEQMVCSKGEF